jgi:hypothetical protein
MWFDGRHRSTKSESGNFACLAFSVAEYAIAQTPGLGFGEIN